MNVLVIGLATGIPIILWLLRRMRQNGSDRLGKDSLISKAPATGKLARASGTGVRSTEEFEVNGKKAVIAVEYAEEALTIAKSQDPIETELAGNASIEDTSQVPDSGPFSSAALLSEEERSRTGRNPLAQSHDVGPVLSSENTAEPSVSEEVSPAVIGNEYNPDIDEIPIFRGSQGEEPDFLLPESDVTAAEPSMEELSAARLTGQPWQSEENDGAENAQIVPARYRPPQQKPPRQPVTRPVTKSGKSANVSQAAAMEIRVRLTLDRFGFVSLGFLPERSPGLDEEIEATDSRTNVRLFAQENWYQDLQFSDAGERLRQGIELKGVLSDGRRVRWRLSGRDIYVLAGHPQANGFVSTSRLLLGRRDVVLCTNELVAQVEAALAEAGCEGYTKFSEAQGLSQGWAGFRGVLPVRAVALDFGSDPLYAVKPSPEIQIELERGICVRNSVWLAGYPPQIKLLGETHGVSKVLIDGREAQHTREGGLTVDGFDLAGDHSVYCEGLSCSRTYSIEEPEESWEQWAAYSFSEADVCGPLVQMKADAVRKVQVSVPMTNPLLLGAEAGQVFQCSSRRTANWTGFVPFDVVWALPAQPLICDKKTARILQFSSGRPVLPERPTKSEFRWCDAILDAGRKGLRIDNGSADSTTCWAEYKKAARNIRRGRR